MDKLVVLVVEDEDNQRLLYEKELTWAGYDVICAANGQEGLDKLKQNKINVVVLDIAMPGIDGIELLGKILDYDNQMPVILNSAYSSYKDDFMTWAAEAYVTKTSDLGELRTTIAQALESRGLQPPTPPEEPQ